MRKFFHNAPKVALTSLIAAIIVIAVLFCLLSFADSHSKILHMVGKVYIAIALPFLMLNPLFGFIYSFYIKGKRKIIYILLHLVCICTISVFSFISFIFRYFVPFAP